MVTFMRIPYALALQRSELQRTLLTKATQGLTSLDQIDWAALDAQIVQQLPPLEPAAG